MGESLLKIGVFGGTFNPVHYGHLIIAEAVRENFKLDKILFIPSGRPPHKPLNEVADSEHRYEMVRLAVASNPFFGVSRVEVDSEGCSYTVNTLHSLRNEFGMKAKLYFIAGADIIPELTTWREFNSVFRLCEFIAVQRPGYEEKDLAGTIKQLKDKYGFKIYLTEAPLVDISSSEIRERRSKGRSIRYLVPESVEEYIYSAGLYK